MPSTVIASFREWREILGEPQTIGDFRAMIEGLEDDMPLAVRNGPLPKLYILTVERKQHLEIEIPCCNAHLPANHGVEQLPLSTKG